jgi:hypothetical protein
VAKKRLLGIDFIRFGAIFLMFWDHGLKLFYDFKTDSAWQNFLTNFSERVIEITSLSSALFLFLVGFCLVISFNRTKEKKTIWIFKKWQKGFGLIFLSYFLFFFKFGGEKMEAIFTSGILQLIGLGRILGSFLFLVRKKIRIVFVATLSYLALVFDLTLRLKNLEIPLLNIHIFPLLPNIFYLFSGLLVAEGWFFWQEEKPRKKYLKKLLFGSLAGAMILILVGNGNPFEIWRSRFYTAGFWHPSAILVVFNTFLAILLLAALALVEEKIAKINLIKKAGLFGQEALSIYFFHILLGWGVSKYLLNSTKFGFWASLLAVIVFCSLGWIWIKLKRNFLLK